MKRATSHDPTGRSHALTIVIVMALALFGAGGCGGGGGAGGGSGRGSGGGTGGGTGGGGGPPQGTAAGDGWQFADQIVSSAPNQVSGSAISSDSQVTGVGAVSDGSAIVAGTFIGGGGVLNPGGTGTASLAMGAYLARYGPDGSVLWAHNVVDNQVEGTAYLSALDDGSSIVAGSASVLGTISIDSQPLSSTCYVAAYHQDGALRWVKSFDDGAPGALPMAVAQGADGSCVVTGVTWTSAVLQSPSAIVARYDPDGALEWARTGQCDANAFGDAVAVYPDGSAIVAGFYGGTITFAADTPSSVTLTSAGGQDIFIVKFASDGSLLWARSAGGASDDIAESVAATQDGGVVVVGYFNADATFGAEGPAPVTLTAQGSQDAFIARYGSDGTFLWARSAGGDTAIADAYGVGALSDGTFVVAGALGVGSQPAGATSTAGVATFGLGEPMETSLDISSGCAFIARYAEDGSLVSVEGTVGGSAIGFVCATGSDRSAIVGGVFESTVIFGSGDPDQQTLTAGSTAAEAFIARFIFPP